MSAMIILPGKPIPQKRARVFQKGGAMDPCWNAKEQHRDYIKRYLNAKFPAFKMIQELTFINLIYAYEYPKSLAKSKRVPHFKDTNPDIDNLTKYILDMGNGLLWEDDGLIAGGYIVKMFAEKSATIILFPSYRNTGAEKLLDLVETIIKETL